MSKKYQRLKRQISNDNGITWNDMGNVYKVGNEMGGAGCTPRIYRTVQADPSIFECDGGNKFYVNEVQYSDNNGLTWITEYQTRGEIMEELSEDCGVAYRWVDVDGEWICLHSDAPTEMSSRLHFLGPSGQPALPVTVTLNNQKFDMGYGEVNVDIKDLGISELTSCNSAFSVQNLHQLYSFPDTSNVTDMHWMFHYCPALTSLDLYYFNTSKVTDMSGMFGGCGFTSLNISSFNTSNVVNMAGMFSGCDGLTSLDLSHFNTSKVTDMNYMFQGCSGLTSLNVSSFNTSKVTDMQDMFADCRSLTSLNISSFNTSNVTTMMEMFAACSGLTSLDLSNFDTSNVTDMTYMFAACSGLTSLDLSNFDTSNVVSVWRMFYDCTNLETLDISGWNISQVGDFPMFDNCQSLKKIIMKGCETTTIDKVNYILSLSEINNVEIIS